MLGIPSTFTVGMVFQLQRDFTTGYAGDRFRIAQVDRGRVVADSLGTPPCQFVSSPRELRRWMNYGMIDLI